MWQRPTKTGLPHPNARGDRHWSHRHPEWVRHGQGKLTEEQVIEILRRWFGNEDETQLELAARFGVCEGTISLVIRRRTWRHVPMPETARKWRG